jgi:DEAD/DEAH box helicase
MTQQTRALERGVDIVVATPGRALDHLRRGSVDLSSLCVLILDEADEMLDMGFADDLDAILVATPGTRQTALFSATMPPRLRTIAERHLRNPDRRDPDRRHVFAGKGPRGGGRRRGEGDARRDAARAEGVGPTRSRHTCPIRSGADTAVLNASGVTPI